MTIQFLFTNMPVHAAAQASLEQKLAKLQRLDRQLDKAQVDISKDRHHSRGDVYLVEVNISPATGAALRGVATGETIIGAANEVIEKITRQLTRKKERRAARRSREEV